MHRRQPPRIVWQCVARGLDRLLGLSDVHDALQAFAWTWLENQVLSAVKLIPLGQSAGQRLLQLLGSRLGAICVRAADLVDS